jgi:isopenicillin-N N-acyltransferase-like protein
VLEVRQDEGPDFVTVVEAGLLAKTGMNAAGLGLVTNALVTDADVGEPGLPYHVLLRAHPDPAAHPCEQGATIASVLMDLTARRIWLAAGNPCQVPYEQLDIKL